MYVNYFAFATEKGRRYYEEKGLILWDIKTEEKVIALTFDDGPHPIYTTQILDILNEFNAKATFFVVGANAEKHPSFISRQINEGHEIANHTYSHSYKLTPHQLEEELQRTSEIIYRITGTYPESFRPVGGSYNDDVINIAVEKGYQVVLWSWHQDTKDWKKPGVKKIVDKVLNGAKPGDVILFHDAGGDRTQTVEALSEIIPELQKQGYKFVTISELLNTNNIEVTR